MKRYHGEEGAPPVAMLGSLFTPDTSQKKTINLAEKINTNKPNQLRRSKRPFQMLFQEWKAEAHETPSENGRRIFLVTRPPLLTNPTLTAEMGTAAVANRSRI